MKNFDKGKEFFEQGKYSQALELLQEAIKEDMTNAEAHYLCGMAFKNNDNETEYKEHIFKSLALNPDHEQALGELKIIVATLRKPNNEGQATEKGFSVSPNKMVRFAKGNLQYDAKTKNWKFADKQHESVIFYGGDVSIKGKNDYNLLDLFEWGAIKTYGLDVSFRQNETEYSNSWRVLSYNEWEYLLCKRPRHKELHRFSKVMGRSGMVILPDDWQGEEIGLYDQDTWEKMESQGAVFLPTAGFCKPIKSSSIMQLTPFTKFWVYQTCSSEKYYFGLIDCFDLFPAGVKDGRIIETCKIDEFGASSYFPVRLVMDIDL